jgi:hypothetical protein
VAGSGRGDRGLAAVPGRNSFGSRRNGDGSQSSLMKITSFALRPGERNPPGNIPPTPEDYAKLHASTVRQEFANLESRLETALAPRSDAGSEEPGSRQRGPGRPKGPYIIQTRAEVVEPYRRLWDSLRRRPSWTQVAREIGVDTRTLKRARDQFGVTGEEIAPPD